MAKNKKEAVLEKIQDEGVQAPQAKETESISKEEQKLIEVARANKKREKEAQEAIVEVLKKYRCDIVVDMQSTLGKPRLKLVLN